MIELLDHQGNDNTVANTARVSMQFDGTWSDLPEDYTEGARDKLIRYLARHKHTSPFRHNSITIRMDIPIFLARQLGKHQAGLSWNEVSRRYVAGDVEFYYPEEWRNKPDSNIKQGSGKASRFSNYYQGVYDKFTTYAADLYESMLEDGIAPEQARMILPQSMMTQVVWTGNLMAFAHVYNLRAEEHAQVEAQEFAKELDSIIRPLFPVSWSSLIGE
jgi:thymidylate synthase (FAD)